MSNIYDTANQLEREFRELPAYQSLKEAFDAIDADQEASELFNKFKNLSQNFQQKQMQGIQPSDEEVQAIQDLSQEVMDNELISQLLDSEQQINIVLNDINQIITQPLKEVYEAHATNQEEVDAAEEIAEEE